MVHDPNRLILVLDDREIVSDEVAQMVGKRRYGGIIYRRQALHQHFLQALPQWAKNSLLHLRNTDDINALHARLLASPEDCAICVIAGRAGFSHTERLGQLIARLPYANEDFTDRLYQPLLVYLKNAHQLVSQWPAFTASPLHRWPQAWQGSQRLQSLTVLDLGRIRDFLSFNSGATATRHFNEVQIDDYYYTKRSADKQKIQAEYAFYELVPERLRPWLVQPFDFRDEGNTASYRMLRYYLADTALQWVHAAFDEDSFAAFVDRMLFFLAERPRQNQSRSEVSAMARTLFVEKVEARVTAFLASDSGRQINRLVAGSDPALDLQQQLARYLRLYARHEKAFALDYLVIGHGDPCFSNVLYDPQRYLLKLIDPKGALDEGSLWTHPLYDLCKLSHSALGDYDFINNGQYQLLLDGQNRLQLQLAAYRHDGLKALFRRQVIASGVDLRIMRLGEASLFLSMLPLHGDHPNKITAFLLKAAQILDEVEFD